MLYFSTHIHFFVIRPLLPETCSSKEILLVGILLSFSEATKSGFVAVVWPNHL